MVGLMRAVVTAREEGMTATCRLSIPEKLRTILILLPPSVDY